MRKDDKYRFSLQWSGDTEEKAAVGALLDRLGNKKSDLVVAAVSEYLERHPELSAPGGGKLQITYHPMQTREQLLEMVKGMTKAAIEEYMAGKVILTANDGQEPTPLGGPSEEELDAMVAGLKLFDT